MLVSWGHVDVVVVVLPDNSVNLDNFPRRGTYPTGTRFTRVSWDGNDAAVGDPLLMTGGRCEMKQKLTRDTCAFMDKLFDGRQRRVIMGGKSYRFGGSVGLKDDSY